jgi:hypothetical protein
MAAATVEICESNGTTPTITHNITNSNMGSTEAVNLDPVAYPITPGTNSFEKWQRIHVTDIGTSSKIDNLKVWRTTALGAEAAHKTNAREASYDGAQTFPTGAGEGPKATDRSATYDYTEAMPTSTPTGANLGIGGALNGALTAAGYSDYLVHQIQTTASAVAGATMTMNYQYDETA